MNPHRSINCRQPGGRWAQRAHPLACLAWAVVAPALFAETPTSSILSPQTMRRHVGNFNRHDHTHFGQAISNEAAADWMADNVPLFECPDKDIEEIYQKKAAQLRQLILEKLWDDPAKFFKVLPRQEGAMPVDVRELHGYTPWYFGIPPKDKGYEVAWKKLMDPQGFQAPYGPTTTERRHPGFTLSYEGHECQWNGPSWPFATSITITALANVLNDYPQDSITRRDYFETLKTYTKSHRLKREDGTNVPWIDENLNPDTGDWIARTRLKSWKDETWDAGKGGIERGKDYNHSTYCDLIITGLVGLRPQADDTVVVNPLLPDDTWDYFCLDGVPYHGRTLTIFYDKTGNRYAKGRGLRLLADGQEIGARESLALLKAKVTTPP